MIKNIIIGIVCLCLLTACGENNFAKKRSRLAKKNKGDIVVGVVWPWAGRWKYLGDGVDLAVEQINQRGGVLGRKITVIKRNDEGSIDRGMQIAYEFSRNINMIAVIGHINSYISIPASGQYSTSGLVMISPGSTKADLTRRNFKNIFRLLPNNEQLGSDLANYAVKKGYKRIIIYYVSNSFGRDLASSFARAAKARGLTIVDRRSYLEDTQNFTAQLSDWKQLYNYDAIFLAGSLPEAALIIKQARQIGVTEPIFASQALDNKELIEIAGKHAEGLVILSAFDMDSKELQVRQFVKAFRKKYGFDPDAPAALGYDAVRLIAYAIKQAGSAEPAKIAKALYGLKSWPGVTGVVVFDSKGDLVGRTLIKRTVTRGKFKKLP